MKRVEVSLSQYTALCSSNINTMRTLWTIRSKDAVTIVLSKYTLFNSLGTGEYVETRDAIIDLFSALQNVKISQNRYSEYI